MTKGLLISILIGGMANAEPSWDYSPYDWRNSDSNWGNSPNNWENSPNNWENHPTNRNSERLIRNNVTGKPQGYAVTSPNGTINFFDLNGNRTGYLPQSQD